MKTNNVSFTGGKIFIGQPEHLEQLKMLIQSKAWKIDPKTGRYALPRTQEFDYKTISLVPSQN